MFWFFAAVVLILCIYEPAFRKLVLWLGGIAAGLCLMVMILAAV